MSEEEQVIEAELGEEHPDQPAGGIEEDTSGEGSEETPEEGEDTADESGDRPKGKTPKWAEKRFAELTKQREEERRRAERLEAMLERTLEQRQAKQEPPKEEPLNVPQTRPRPTLEGCDYDSERFTDELTDWKLEQREAKREAENQRRQYQDQNKRQQQTIMERSDETYRKGGEKYEDFKHVVDTALNSGQIAPPVVRAILESDASHDVAYYLGKNPAEAARIATLNPYRMAIEIGKLEAKVSVAPPPKKATSAPPPAKPIKSDSATANAEPDPAKDPEGWRRWEQARVRALGRRY